MTTPESRRRTDGLQSYNARDGIVVWRGGERMNQPELASDIMVSSLVTLRPDMHVFDGIKHLLKNKITGAPVVDAGRRYLGVFSEKCCMSVLTVSARLACENKQQQTLRARDFMVKRLVTLSPDSDVFEAITLLLKNRISGAPVVDSTGKFLGIFSEKTSMQVLISAAYEQLPTTRVEAFMNEDSQRVIHEDATLLDVAEIFLTTPYRRLEVLKDGQLLGQISRRDVLKAEHPLAKHVRHYDANLTNGGWAFHRRDDQEHAEEAEIPTPEVSSFMDRSAKTIPEDTDFLRIARVFLDTPYRRLPVLREEKLAGQISRRDILRTAHDMIAAAPKQREPSLLYLSSLVERSDAPIR